MRIKTIVVILITILLTVVIMQNQGKISFAVLWMNFYVSKLFVMLVVAIVAFVIGYLAGRPKRRFNLSETTAGSIHDSEEPDTLSEEDRNYIN